MTMADVLLGMLVVLGLLIAFPATGLLLRALAPDAVHRSRDRLLRSPGVCFLAGLLPAALLFLLPLLLGQQGGPGLKVLGLVLFSGGLLLAGTGLAGLASLVGERLPSAADEGRSWRGLVRGAVCMELTFLLPFVGWFVFLPVAAVTASGAAMLAAFSGRGTPAPAPSPAGA